MSEWSPELEALAVIVDRLSDLIGVSIAAAGGKPPTFKSFQRPKTEVDRLLDEQRKAQHEHLVRQLLPHTLTEAS
ncbi:MAG: hypothetical protein JWP14_3372 [Frankiales bacterium]|nr:hypothetical protein [Frankiales bacterium]